MRTGPWRQAGRSHVMMRERSSPRGATPARCAMSSPLRAAAFPRGGQAFAAVRPELATATLFSSGGSSIGTNTARWRSGPNRVRESNGSASILQAHREAFLPERILRTWRRQIVFGRSWLMLRVNALHRGSHKHGSRKRRASRGRCRGPAPDLAVEGGAPRAAASASYAHPLVADKIAPVVVNRASRDAKSRRGRVSIAVGGGIAARAVIAASAIIRIGSRSRATAPTASAPNPMAAMAGAPQPHPPPYQP